MKPPVTAKQKKILTRFLALSPDPDDTFTYDELMGYLFGVAITPEVILPSEWMDQIFGEEKPVYDSLRRHKKCSAVLCRCTMPSWMHPRPTPFACLSIFWRSNPTSMMQSLPGFSVSTSPCPCDLISGSPKNHPHSRKNWHTRSCPA